MKAFLKTNWMMIILCSIFMACGSNSNKHELASYKQNVINCDLNTGVFIGLLYIKSCPGLFRDNSEFISLVNQYYTILDEDSDAIKCMRTLGEELVHQGTQNFNFTNDVQNQVHERTMNMAMNHGMVSEAQSFADNVVSSMKNEQLQPIIIGQELIWLSEVLPYAADDNWDYYNNTGTYFRKAAIDQIEQIELSLQMLGHYGGLTQDDLELLGIVSPAIDKWSTKYGIGYIVATGIHLGVFK